MRALLLLVTVLVGLGYTAAQYDNYCGALGVGSCAAISAINNNLLVANQKLDLLIASLVNATLVNSSLTLAPIVISAATPVAAPLFLVPSLVAGLVLSGLLFMLQPG